MAKDRKTSTINDEPIYGGKNKSRSLFKMLFTPDFYDECAESNKTLKRILKGDIPKSYMSSNTKKQIDMNEKQLTENIEEINNRLTELSQYSFKLSELSKDIDAKLREANRRETELSFELRGLKSLKRSLYDELAIPKTI